MKFSAFELFGPISIAQSAGVVEYTDRFFAEW